MYNCGYYGNLLGKIRIYSVSKKSNWHLKRLEKSAISLKTRKTGNKYGEDEKVNYNICKQLDCNFCIGEKTLKVAAHYLSKIN